MTAETTYCFTRERFKKAAKAALDCGNCVIKTYIQIIYHHRGRKALWEWEITPSSCKSLAFIFSEIMGNYVVSML